MIRSYTSGGIRGVVVNVSPCLCVSVLCGREALLPLVEQADDTTTVHVLVYVAGFVFAVASFDPEEDPR